MTPLFGREAQLAGWDDALTCGHSLAIRGEAGIGKSRLIAEFATIARTRGRTVLRGRGLADALLPVTRRDWPDLPSCYRDALGDVVPEWHTGKPVRAEVQAEAVVRLLHTVNGVLILDGPGPHPHIAANAVIVTTERVSCGPGLLPRLSEEDSAALVEALGGDRSVCHRAEGLPLALVELSATGNSPTIEAFVVTTLHRLGPDAAEVAHACAVLDAPVHWSDVQPLTTLDADTVAAALHDLADADVLVDNRFRHSLMRDTVLRRTSPTTSARHHAALARRRLIQRSYACAEAAATTALKLAPTKEIRTDAVDTLTAALTSLGRFAEALDLLEPGGPHSRAARCAIELGDHTAAQAFLALTDDLGTALFLTARRALSGDPADAAEPLTQLRDLPGWQERAALELGVVDCLTVVSPFRLQQALDHAHGDLRAVADHHLATVALQTGDPVDLTGLATSELWHTLLAADTDGALHYAQQLAAFPETRGIHALLTALDRADFDPAHHLLDHGIGTWTNRGLARLALGDEHGWTDADRSPVLSAIAAVLLGDLPRLQPAHGTFVSIANAPWRRRCEKAMRESGIPVPRRGRGDASVPSHLRAFGVTSREMDVLLLIARGTTNADIALELSMSRRTVDTHVRSLLTKTGSTRRTNLSALV